MGKRSEKKALSTLKSRGQRWVEWVQQRRRKKPGSCEQKQDGEASRKASKEFQEGGSGGLRPGLLGRA